MASKKNITRRLTNFIVLYICEIPQFKIEVYENHSKC